MFDDLEKKSQEGGNNTEDIFQETDKFEDSGQPIPPSIPKEQLERMKSKENSFSTDKYRPYREPVSSGAKKLRMGVIIVVIVAVLGFGVYYMYNNLLKADEVVENNPAGQVANNNLENKNPDLEEDNNNDIEPSIEVEEEEPEEVIVEEEPEVPEIEDEEPVVIEPEAPIEEPEPEFANQDPDSDGLSTAQELGLYNTNPNNPDTDGDGLNDGDEVNIYNTDPLNDDSDGDSYLDGEEVKNGYNPLGDGLL